MAGIRLWMILAIVIVIVGLLLLWKNNYEVLTVGLPLLAWVGLLLMRKDQSSQKRIVLGLLGVGVAITMGVEVVVLQGDVGRSNTVFRFYNQVWALFSVAAGATLVWMIPIIRQWSRQWRESWLWALALLVLAAASYTVIATPMKMDDRWPGIANPPHNLDGMAYMLGEDQSNAGVPGSTQGAVYKDEERPMNLASDYAGIRFVQDHISGTPTLVEGYTSEYRWGARYSIYTGLPAVIGWNWHVRQHNSILPASVVENRIEEVNQFYNTPDPNAALEFLRRYHVNYIVVGDLERVYYSAEGLAKFQQMVQQGMLQVAFGGAGSGEATIYRVLQ